MGFNTAINVIGTSSEWKTKTVAHMQGMELSSAFL